VEAQLLRFFVAWMLLLCAPVWAASGQALGVDPDAEARGTGGKRTLVVGADIFIGDRVVTGSTGLVQILFSDDTELVVGPRSSLVIEDYLLREDGSAGKLAINALSGTFRFVTGGSPKASYSINTPTGIIGVRGTAFELFVTKQAHWLMEQQGATINCNKSGDCVTAKKACEIAVVRKSGAELVGKPSDFDDDQRDELRDWFHFAADQSSLMRTFRISGAEKCFRRAAPEAPAGSLGDPELARRGNDNEDTSD
jgi:hypothetical protein